MLDGVDWQVESGRALGRARAERFGQDDLLQVAGARLWPTAGRVEVLGSTLGRVDVRTLRPRVALVSGAVTRQLRADLTARDVVASGRHGALETWWHRYAAEDWEKADVLLAQGGVGEIADRSFGVISEGERQQVLLARALDERPRARAARRAVRRARPRRPGAPARAPGALWPRTPRARRSSW